MKRSVSLVLVLLIALLAVFSPAGLAGASRLAEPLAPQAGAPSVVSYQGQVTLSGTPYTGTGYFKFAVVDAAGTTTYWSNNGSSVNGSEPTAAISLPVNNGLFNVLLGDTSLMTALPASAFSSASRNLRVWFSSNGSAFTLLSPDRRIAAAPYALQAQEAANADTLDGQHASAFAAAGSGWSLTGNAGTDPVLNYVGTSDGASLTLGVNGAGAAWLNPAGNLGLGTNTPAERLTVRGNAQVLGMDNPVARGYTSANLDVPLSVAVAGHYAYVASFYNDRLAVFDVSDPNNLVALGFTNANLSGPMSVAVAGRNAYVTSRYTHRLTVFDVSDPNNLVALGFTSANLAAPASVAVAGRYAYVTSWANDSLAVFDVSDPNNLVALGHTSANLDFPDSVAVAGRYAYVTSYDNDRLAVFDVSDPSNLVALGFTSTNLDGPETVAVVGRYAYVVSFNNSRLAVFDVSDPNNLVALGFTSANLNGLISVAVAGRYAYVTSRDNSRLAVFDVSDPNNLVALGFTSANLNSPASAVVAGRYAYVASTTNDRLAVFDLNHLEAPTADIGSLRTGGLHVGENAIVGNGLAVQGSLTVGQGGALINGDLGIQGNLFAHLNVTTVTASTPLVVTQSGVVLVNNAADATITLPAAASTKGLTFTIKRLTANAVTVGSGGGTIDDAATQALAAQYDFITVISDGANWYITGR